MINKYLNQIALWYKAIGINDYGESTYDTPVSIRVRWEGKRRLVRNNEGREVVSEAKVFCKEDINPGDLLEYAGVRWPVINILVLPNFDGSESHKEVSV